MSEIDTQRTALQDVVSALAIEAWERSEQMSYNVKAEKAGLAVPQAETPKARLKALNALDDTWTDALADAQRQAALVGFLAASTQAEGIGLSLAQWCYQILTRLGQACHSPEEFSRVRAELHAVQEACREARGMSPPRQASPATKEARSRMTGLLWL